MCFVHFQERKLLLSGELSIPVPYLENIRISFYVAVNQRILNA